MEHNYELECAVYLIVVFICLKGALLPLTILYKSALKFCVLGMNKFYSIILIACAGLIFALFAFTQQSTSPRNTPPYDGMVFIPGGTFIMGQSGQDITYSQVAQSRQVTISPFYMDVTEVTNEKYKEFVNWVRDSVLVRRFLNTPEYLIQNPDGTDRIDWAKLRKNSPWSSRDENLRSQVDQMYYSGADQIFGKKELDARLINYEFGYYDIRSAIQHRNDPTKFRSDFVNRETINVYPDTTVWLADFSYGQNEPMLHGYFALKAFEKYPVVGVNWKQAEAFNHWRTKVFEDSQNGKKNKKEVLPFMLPSEAQWEYAARGGKIGMPYPWGGPTPRNGGGMLLANFKPGRGAYLGGPNEGDKYPYTAPVASFDANDFGLYDMAGNVAEWTSSTYNESATILVHDLNPTYRYDANESDPEALKRKAIRGGSWKDVAFFLQNSARTYEYQDSARSYIGFRSVTALPGVK